MPFIELITMTEREQKLAKLLCATIDTVKDEYTKEEVINALNATIAVVEL